MIRRRECCDQTREIVYLCCDLLDTMVMFDLVWHSDDYEQSH